MKGAVADPFTRRHSRPTLVTKVNSTKYSIILHIIYNFLTLRALAFRTKVLAHALRKSENQQFLKTLMMPVQHYCYYIYKS